MHLTEDEIECYCQRQMTAENLLGAADHLRVCGDCRNRVAMFSGETAEVTANAFRNQLFVEANCLSYEQKEAYVDGVLSKEFQTEVVIHLKQCRICDSSVAAMKAMKAEFEQSQTAEKVISQSGQNWWRALWHRFDDGVQTLTWKPAMTAAMAVVALAAIAWWMWSAPLNQGGHGNDQTAVKTNDSSPAPNDSTVVAINDAGARVVLKANGDVEGLGTLTSEEREMVANALRNQKLEASSAFQGQNSAGVLMSDNGVESRLDAASVSPNRVAVETTVPTFHWPDIKGASSYVVTIYDENLNEIESSAPLTANQWKPSKPLPRGKIYGWQISVNRDASESLIPSPAEPRIRFKVIEQTHAAALQRARGEFSNSHLMLGLTYSRAGMSKEAESEFRKLVAENPDSVTAKALLSQSAQRRREK